MKGNHKILELATLPYLKYYFCSLSVYLEPKFEFGVTQAYFDGYHYMINVGYLTFYAYR